MTRPPLTRLAACLATGLVAAGLVGFGPAWVPGSPAAATAAEEEKTPLKVSIDALTPSTIPRRGDITIAGQITNRSDSTWTDLNVYMLTSFTPMTSGEELVEASRTDPTSEVGARITNAGQYDEIGDLEPGESTTYFLDVPRRSLPVSGEPGVYWLGVHVLGANEDGRDGVADGRARSFLPLMRNSGPSASVSLVVPVKGEVRRRADGTLFNLRRWQRDLSPDGRLGRLTDLLGTSVSTPTTLVVDPAVVDAARSVAADNPPLDTAPTDGEGDGEPTPLPSESPSGDATTEPSPEDTSESEDEPPAEPSAEAQEAADWLTGFVEETSATGQHDVLSVPYGDADVAAMLRNDFEELYHQAVDLSTTTMEDLGVESAPVVAPPHGRIPNAALPRLDADTTLLLSDLAAPEAESSLIETPNGHDAVLTSSSVASGGPAPAPRFSALAMRQRILSEAAVHALTATDSQPLVVTTPQLWNPGSEWRSADFFGGLDVPWLNTVDLTSATAVAGALSGSEGQYDAPLAYPRASVRAELPIANLLATDELRATGVTFASLLTRNDTVDQQLAKTAMFASSVHARDRPHSGVVATRRVSDHIRSLMAEVSIDGPPFVTMSSGQGTFQVTVVNDLEEPVTVGIRPDTTGDGLVIEQPQPVSLGPGQRASVRLKATSKGIGVYSVTLVPMTSEGHQLSGSTKLSIRSSQVGLVIWIIMGVGAAILVAAIAFRITRRVRERKADPVPPARSEHA